MIYAVDTKEAFQDVLSCLQDGMKLKHHRDNVYKFGNDMLEFTSEFKEQLEIHDIIYGVNKETNIVNISQDGENIYIFKETSAGVEYKTIPYYHWVLAKKKLNSSFSKLEGNQPYSFYKEYNYDDFTNLVKPQIYKMGLYTIHQPQENVMVRHGYTYFKGMKSEEVSLLSFDIETTGLDPKSPDAKLLLHVKTPLS